MSSAAIFNVSFQPQCARYTRRIPSSENNSQLGQCKFEDVRECFIVHSEFMIQYFQIVYNKKMGQGLDGFVFFIIT